MQVRRLDMAADNLFDPIVKALKNMKLIRTTNLGRGVISAASARNIFNVGSDLLKKDPLALIADRKAYINARDATRIALLSSANLDTFADHFESAASEWLNGDARIFVPPFGQYRQNIYEKDSKLFSFNPEWLFFLERAEDILGPVLFEPYEYKDIGFWKDDIENRVQSYTKTIRVARERSGAKIIVLNFATPANSYLGLSDSSQEMGHKEAIKHANRVLSKKLKKDDVFILDFEVITSSFGSHNLSDDKFWYLGRIPFSRDFGNFLSRRLLGTMLALTQKTARLIVTDLDNTLWHGVIGEDGVENIGIGTDFPGNAYRDFQKTLKALAKRGIALAICSKNTEANALAAFSKRPEMVLNEDDFAASRINWTNKANNIRSIAEEMSLGLGSICFLDDDPHERALVRQQLPEVFVPELPYDPVKRPRALLELPCLESLEVTPEDLRRSQQYKSRAAIESIRQTADSLEDFYYD
ncbi:MAG: HAD-IIIC family phosphatase, partial [Verrucomicrobiota bacterium]|nr:HAD-IIIC family phosphatase [Verrucomicrobiota bacterium]